jgi:alanine-glyoxylate transaminase/serine-glyoxylate transaminase/serine-pyruvate transaminase
MDYVYGPGRNHLFVPGPVNIPEPVIRAMNRNNEDYRSPAVPAMTRTLLEDVKKIFKTTTGTPFLIPTTGNVFINMVIAFIVGYVRFPYKDLIFIES